MKRPLRLLALALCLLLASLFGCSERTTRAIAPPVDLAPRANSPTGAVRLLEWIWNNRDTTRLDLLLTCDYEFVFATGDSAGNAYRERPWTLEDELVCTHNMFAGAPSGPPPATRITFDMDPNLVEFPDPRPGKESPWHRVVRTSVDLKIEVEDGSTLEVGGFATFYMVRGDSACIPVEAQIRGVRPDSTRWWIERWEDETLPSGGTRGYPSQNRTLGQIKALYR